MKKINLKKELTMFGKPVHDQNGPILINQAIAGLLVQERSSNPTKMISICIRLHDNGEVELDEDDFNFFKNAVKNCNLASDILVDAILKELEK